MIKYAISFPFSLFLVGLSLVLSCKEETSRQPTIVEGRVFDIKTGIGLDSAIIQFSEKEEDDDQNTTLSSRAAVSNAEGFFTISIPIGKAALGFFATKNGYLGKIIKPNPAGNGLINNIQVPLFPEDSWLKLTLRNKLDQHDSLFGHLWNDTIFPMGYGCPILEFPTVLAFNQEKVEVFGFSGDTYTRITWAFSSPEYLMHPITDSIYMPLHDTITHIINF